MKTNPPFPFKILIAGLMCLAIMVAGCSKDPVVSPAGDPASDDALLKASIELTDEEIESLMFMVEEEKLAMDVYNEMYANYNLQIFFKIAESEFKHVNAMSNFFVKYGLINPISGNPPGEFENEELQLLYDDLISMGGENKIQALNVGVLIESKDIQDIQYYLDNVIVAKDLEKSYSHLLLGSYKHLAAFNAELE